MKFAAKIRYIQDADKIQNVRPSHRAYLTDLLANEKLVAAGPFLDNYGALIIYEAPDLTGAEELIKNDPFHREGIFIDWEIHPWNTVFANKNLLPG